ncbi:MAG TPA: D-aminoacyl-tRNA deacylase [Gemmatimonadaceae bacterium]
MNLAKRLANLAAEMRDCVMRIVLQRVSRAEVCVGNAAIGEIGRGLVVFVGFTHADGSAEIAWMVEKVLGLRVFADDDGKMNRSVTEVSGSLLVVSQFTLYGDVRKGRRPSFVEAARPEVAIPLYQAFVSALRQAGAAVATGEFGAEMKVDLLNDGPVTLVLERSPKGAE